MRSSGLVLFTCACLLLSGGAVLGGSTTWMLLRISYYFWVSEVGVELGSSLLFVAGALLCLPVCWLATLVPYNRRSMSLLAALMSLAIAALVLLSAGLSSLHGLAQTAREPAALNSSMHRALRYSELDPNVRNALACMQLELKCCGVQSYLDWYAHRPTLPISCCGKIQNLKDDSCHTPTYYNGCLRPALYELRVYTNSLAALGCALIIALAVTLFACAYVLVSNVSRTAKFQPSLRIACLSQPQLLPAPFPHAPSTNI